MKFGRLFFCSFLIILMNLSIIREIFCTFAFDCIARRKPYKPDYVFSEVNPN